MNALQQVVRRSLWVGVGGAAMLVAGCAGMSPGKSIALSGNQTVPPVTTNATGTAEITIRHSKCPSAATGLPCPQVFGTVTTSGVAATAVHIHQAATGKNGPVVVPLTKTGDNVWVVAPNTYISDAQFYDYGQGELYVNVHSDANKGGEIRGQLKP
jgi:hypothetical protein